MSDRFVPVPPARTGSDVIQPGNCRDVDNPIGTQKTYVILAQRPHWPVRLTGKLPKCVFGREHVGNAVWWRARVHKGCLLSSFSFWSSAFRCFLWMKLLRPRFCRLGRVGNVWFTRSSRARDSVCCRPMRHLVQDGDDLAINIDTSWHGPRPSLSWLLKRLLLEEGVR